MAIGLLILMLLVVSAMRVKDLEIVVLEVEKASLMSENLKAEPIVWPAKS